MSSTTPIPDADLTPRIGVLGAGQLGRMLALAGLPLGYRFVFVDPSPGAPAAAVGEQIACAYADPVGQDALAACLVVTYEFESVPVEAAEALAERVPVFPPPFALRVAQDRLAEKSCFRALGIGTAPFEAVDSLEDLTRAVETLGLPAVLKTRRLGYDGKGQVVLRRAEDVASAWDAVGQAPSILEGFVHFERELSLIAVRGRDGEIAFYPLVENHHRHGILRKTISPAPALTLDLQAAAETYAIRILEHLDYVGVLALELFEKRGMLVANEIAPRVHNSGHHSLEGSHTSQFENHLRAILGLPLGDTSAVSPSCMLNLVGTLPQREAVLAIPDTHLHLYGKAPRPGRKVGHITVRAKTEAELATRVAELEAIPGVCDVE
ncbi:MAG TPA: 5-(carboxyamino)imidazole ribonucleotide synthase [Polyangiaceae bacterium]|nr:5-(carboxyamino)imidazole ribonucleotide synthase [Polyangiaceae bacterium]